MSFPEVELKSTQYHRDGSFETTEVALTEIETRAMDMVIALGEEALHDGNPPIGAVIIDYDSGQMVGGKTIDKTTPRLLAHAEIRAYNLAQNKLGDDLKNAVLLSSAQPCTTCTPPYAEGKIGKIIFGAPRWAIFEVAGIMRPRRINLHELLTDGDTETTVTEGYRAEEILGMFSLWASLRDAGKVK